MIGQKKTKPSLLAFQASKSYNLRLTRQPTREQKKSSGSWGPKGFMVGCPKKDANKANGKLCKLAAAVHQHYPLTKSLNRK